MYERQEPSSRGTPKRRNQLTTGLSTKMMANEKTIAGSRLETWMKIQIKTPISRNVPSRLQLTMPTRLSHS